MSDLDFLNDPSFNPGAIPEKPDARTVTVSEAQFEGVMGAPFIDWDAGYNVETELGIPLPVSNQQSSLSCVGQAWRYYAEALEIKETDVFKKFSARDIYSQIFYPQGGSAIIEGAKVLAGKGIAEFQDMPDDIPVDETKMRSRSDATPTSVEKAKRYKAHSFAMIPAFTNVDQFMTQAAQAIMENDGAVTGMTGSNPGWQSEIVRPPRSGEVTWGHSCYAMGFGKVNGKRAIRLKNSWSVAWGNQGNFWLTEDYFNSGNVFSFYTLVDLPDTWLDDLHNMLNVIKDPSSPNLYVVGKDGFIHQLGDEETWTFLKQNGIVSIDFAQPTVDQFKTYTIGQIFPSVKLTQKVLEAAKDILGIK